MSEPWRNRSPFLLPMLPAVQDPLFRDTHALIRSLMRELSETLLSNRDFKNMSDSYLEDVKTDIKIVTGQVVELQTHLRHHTAQLYKLDQQFTAMQTRDRNSQILHLGQTILPIAMLDRGHRGLLPYPERFPKTALEFYRLQFRKNWDLLYDLLIYYQLGEEFMRCICTGILMPIPDYDRRYSQHEIRTAIAYRPWDAVVVLGNLIGVDCEQLHARVLQAEASQAMAQKRVAEDIGRQNCVIRPRKH